MTNNGKIESYLRESTSILDPKIDQSLISADPKDPERSQELALWVM
ncbi:hypothetical protein H6F88_31280 [Oculatella sp. FACHB-28]|nr:MULTISPECIES: hypothetical protein [Cyanophyceae]MBD2000226.1 hypothetical protein [Leptolyngbya sp. FACHB-541]MBD2060428.1 hypothetical protein [Oculatella sp. FACHB-28]